MPKFKVTVHVDVEVTQEDFLALSQGISKPDLGIHVLNTILSQAGVRGGRFMGISMDVDMNSIAPSRG